MDLKVTGPVTSDLTLKPVVATTENRQKVVCVGSSLRFSDRYIKMLDELIDDADFVRVANVDQLTASETVLSNVALVVLDEAFGEQLRSDATAVFRECAGSSVALAYSRVDIAQSVLARSDSDRALKELSFFPLNSQFEAGLSILRLLLCGEQYLPAELFKTSAATDVKGVTYEQASAVLTPREWEVLALVSEGKQNKTIAHSLELSEHTVKLHLHHILSKLEVANRTEASAWYFAQVSR